MRSAEGVSASSDLHRPTRVLHVVRPASAGIKAHVMQVAAGLEPSGFEAEIACPGDSDVVESALAAGLAVLPVPLVRSPRLLKDLETIAVLTERIRQGSIDIVHSHGLEAALVAGVAAALSGCGNHIVTIHGPMLDPEVSGVPRWRHAAVRRWVASRASRVITNSDSLRAELVARFGIPSRLVTTVYDGVDLAPYRDMVDPGPIRDRYGLPRDALVFGLAARFSPRKAMGALVEAAVPVLERLEDAWLLLAGDGPLVEEVRRQASGTAVSDRILFPGYETDVRGLLAALDVFVSAAAPEDLWHTCIEAAAVGLPVISARAAGTVEVVADGETGMLVEAGRPEELSSAMLKLARDPALRVSMGEAGRRRALELFAEERMLERTADVYREVLCSSSRR